MKGKDESRVFPLQARSGLVFVASIARAGSRFLSRGGEGGLWRSLGFAFRHRLMPMLPHLPGQIRLAGLFSRHGLAELRQRYPALEYKYLRNYLALSFSHKTRQEILVHHYRYMADRVDPGFFARIYDAPAHLAQIDCDGIPVSIQLSFPHSIKDNGLERHDQEGDLALLLCLPEGPFYKATFTFAPGRALGIPDHASLAYIGCVQGLPGARETVKKVTAAMHRVHPSVLLISAVAAVASALDVHGIAGVAHSAQPCTDHGLHFDYDELWSSLGGTPRGKDVFFLPIPLPEKSLEDYERKHRKRIMQKRAFLQSVREQVQAALAEHLLATARPGQPVLADME